MNAASRRVSLGALMSVALSLVGAGAVVPSADAALGTVAGSISGAGVGHPGREVTVSLRMTNTTPYKGMTPDLISALGFEAPGVRFNGHAGGVKTCTARIRKDGFATRCPRGSVVGGGRVRAVIGTPGTASDLYGPLSHVDGRFRLYNFRRPAGKPARMLAVIVTRRPFGGLALNLPLTVDRDGIIRVTVPTLSSLPRAIAKAYPKGTKVVLTSMNVTIRSPRGTRGRPFAWRTGSLGVGVNVWATSPSGVLRPPQAGGSRSARGYRRGSAARAAGDRSTESQPFASGKSTQPRVESGAPRRLTPDIFLKAGPFVTGENWCLSSGSPQWFLAS